MGLQGGEDGNIQPLVPFGYLLPGAVVDPGADTAVFIDPFSGVVSINGNFNVTVPGLPEIVSFEGNSQIRFRPGQSVPTATAATSTGSPPVDGALSMRRARSTTARRFTAF